MISVITLKGFQVNQVQDQHVLLFSVWFSFFLLQEFGINYGAKNDKYKKFHMFIVWANFELCVYIITFFQGKLE